MPTRALRARFVTLPSLTIYRTTSTTTFAILGCRLTTLTTVLDLTTVVTLALLGILLINLATDLTSFVLRG